MNYNALSKLNALGDQPAPEPSPSSKGPPSVPFVLAVGISRVYLGAHYSSDVLAGICEGIAWVSVCALLRARTMRA